MQPSHFVGAYRAQTTYALEVVSSGATFQISHRGIRKVKPCSMYGDCLITCLQFLKGRRRVLRHRMTFLAVRNYYVNVKSLVHESEIIINPLFPSTIETNNVPSSVHQSHMGQKLSYLRAVIHSFLKSWSTKEIAPDLCLPHFFICAGAIFQSRMPFHGQQVLETQQRSQCTNVNCQRWLLLTATTSSNGSKQPAGIEHP